MQILLISPNKEQKPFPVSPLGLAYVAAPLIKEKHRVEILDLCFVDNINLCLSNTLKTFKPDLIGLSVRNVDNLTYPGSVSYVEDIKKIVDFLKDHTKAPLVLGGSGFSLFPEEMLRYFGLFMGIVGDGETAFKKLVLHLSQEEKLYKTSNLAYIKDGCFYQNLITFNKSFYSPARALLNNAKYFQLGGMANIETKRGCPFKCAYCTYPFLNGNCLRCRDSGDVVDELEEIVKKYNIDDVFFVDDIFNQPLEHAIGLCEGIIKKSLRLKWTCFATPMGMTQELVKLMKKAGCMGIEFGTDVVTPQCLAKMRKPFDVKEIVKASKFCDKIGLQCAHYLILGGPGETLDTLRETFAFMDMINPKAIIAMLGVRIYPHTKLRDISLQEGVIKESDNLLKPRFYISPKVGEKELLLKVRKNAESKSNWIVPGLEINYSSEVFDVLRKFGNRGPLWNLLVRDN